MQQMYEKLIKRKWGMLDYIRIATIVCGVILLWIIVLMLWTLFSDYGVSVIVPFALIGVGYGGYYMINSLRQEYEFCYFQGEMDCDVITARRKRRRVMTLKVRDFEKMAPYADFKDSGYDLKTSFNKKYYMVSELSSEDNYYVAFKHETGIALLVFEPDERMLAEMKAMAPRAVTLAKKAD